MSKDVNEDIRRARYTSNRLSTGELCEMEMSHKMSQSVDLRVQRLLSVGEALDSVDPCVFLETNPAIGDKIYAVRLERLYDGEHQPVETCDVYQIGIDSPLRLFLQFYGKTWRCWKSNPTKEDRLSVDWNV